MPEAALLLGLAALAGVVGSWLLARRIKAQTHGLEPAEIATLADQREALLYSIREGVLGVDSADRVTFANDGARDLLDLPEQCVGPPGRRAGAVAGRGRRAARAGWPAPTWWWCTGTGRWWSTGAPPAPAGSEGPRSGQPIGTVITLRDRSDLIAVQRQLGATRSATETLRAQTHEFDNQLHIISGLVQMGEYDEVREYLATLTRKRAEFDATHHRRIADPALAALLVAKSSLATESSVALALVPTSRCPKLDAGAVHRRGHVARQPDRQRAGRGGQRRARGGRRGDHRRIDDEVRVVVTDTGPGVPKGAVDQVFARGYSTKSSAVAGGRGRRARAGPDDLRAARRLGERAQRRETAAGRRGDRRRVHRGARPPTLRARRRRPTRSGWRRQ